MKLEVTAPDFQVVLLHSGESGMSDGNDDNSGVCRCTFRIRRKEKKHG